MIMDSPTIGLALPPCQGENSIPESKSLSEKKCPTYYVNRLHMALESIWAMMLVTHLEYISTLYFHFFILPFPRVLNIIAERPGRGKWRLEVRYEPEAWATGREWSFKSSGERWTVWQCEWCTRRHQYMLNKTPTTKSGELLGPRLSKSPRVQFSI